MTPVEKWAEQVRAGEVRAVSRAITAIENHAPESEELLRLLFPHTGRAYLTGVTGAPGTGKSTLGDRIRMQGHAGDAGTFIRSMATRGFLGGLARATAEVALLLDAAGKKHVL